METLYADAHIGKVQLRRGGSGPALVYLHSANGEGEGLLLLDLLAERFDVVPPMFPGFGDSEGLDQIDDMEDATHKLKAAQGQQINQRPGVDAGTRSLTPRNYEVKWSGPDGVVLDVSQSGWLGAP